MKGEVERSMHSLKTQIFQKRNAANRGRQKWGDLGYFQEGIKGQSEGNSSLDDWYAYLVRKTGFKGLKEYSKN